VRRPEPDAAHLNDTEAEALIASRDAAFGYIRAKVDQLLGVMGTLPLRPEELDDETLLALDPIGIIAASFDHILEHLRETNEALTVARNEVQAILDSAGAAILVVDSQMRLEVCNQQAQELFFSELNAVEGEPLCDILQCASTAAEREVFKRILETGSVSEQGDLVHEGRHYHFVATPLQDAEGRVTRAVFVYSDFTERRLAQEQVRQLAYFDSLTGLPNRTLIHDRIKDAIALARRQGHAVAVLFIDLDRFKPINDTLGHEAGDKVLRMVGARLTESVRATDTVARLGGDEFLVTLTSLTSNYHIAPLTRKILDALAEPYDVDGREVFTGASIGVGLYPDDGESPTDLIRKADMAMYAAKGEGRNTYRFYSDDLNRKAKARMELDARLRRALHDDEFSLAFQPQVDLLEGRVFGAEALVRWKSTDHRPMAPGAFIPVAEENGLIIPLGDWVLRKACREATGWQTLQPGGVKLAVNLSPIQLGEHDFCDRLEQILDETGLPPGCLELEITEGMLMERFGRRLQTLERIKAMGVGLTIDDFGTGYSSLSYLKDFPLDRLKIAQEFMASVPGNAGSCAIVEAIIALARSLTLGVVAEGVETEEQMAFLRRLGCCTIQGYLFSRPVGADRLKEIFAEGKAAMPKCPQGVRADPDPAPDG
jgi:diguanylate cyclase (GGDEF)-like protein